MQTELELRAARVHLEQTVARLTAEVSRLDQMLQTEIVARQHAEEQLRLQAPLADLTEDALIVCGLDGRVLYWNQRAARIYGWPAELATGKNLTDLIYPPDTSLFSVNLAATIEKQEHRAEERHFTQHGQELIVATRWTLRHNTGGKEEIHILNSDITEQKEMERQFLRMQRLETVGLLASGIAHDLNNVLAPILMAAQNLLKEIKEESQLELLRSIEASARRGGALVHQVLSFARGTEGERVPLQFQTLLHEFQRVARDTFPRSIHIITRFGKKVGPVLGNKTQLYQAIMNLCVNARDAMPNGGILQIEANNVLLPAEYVSRHPPATPGEYLMLRIIDNGVGIPEDHIEKIFDPFFTTKETGKGTGLGLSTVISILKRHGGFLEVTSKTGRGSKFTIYLPTIDMVEKPGHRETPPQFPSGNSKVILIVDDERVVRDITGSTLKQNGYRILAAADGTEGFALFTQHRQQIAAVITDMSMPYMDGAKMIRALLQIDPRIKIIAMSGLDEDLKVLSEIRKKPIPFLKKPFSVEELLETLHHLLEESGASKPSH